MLQLLGKRDTSRVNTVEKSRGHCRQSAALTQWCAHPFCRSRVQTVCKQNARSPSASRSAASARSDERSLESSYFSSDCDAQMWGEALVFTLTDFRLLSIVVTCKKQHEKCLFTVARKCILNGKSVHTIVRSHELELRRERRVLLMSACRHCLLRSIQLYNSW